MARSPESERKPTGSKLEGRSSPAAQAPHSDYFPPFQTLAKLIREENGQVSMPGDVFELLLRDALAANGFDGAWYRSVYSDVARALREGSVKNEFLHFAQSGYREGRLPRHFAVDEAWYRARYPDIDEEIRAGRISTAQHHYLTAGYFEGRFPSAAAEAQAESWTRLVYMQK